MSDKIDLYSDRGVLLKSDVDLSAVKKARDTIAVLRNRAEFTTSHRAESLR